MKCCNALHVAARQQVVAVSVDGAFVRRVADGQSRGQGPYAEKVLAIKLAVGGEAFEEVDLAVERKIVEGEEAFERGEVARHVAPLRTEVGIEGHGVHVGGVHLDGAAQRDVGQRVAARGGIGLAEREDVALLVRRGLDGLSSLVDGVVELPRGDEKHTLQVVDLAETHVGRVEYGDGQIGLPFLLVEHRHDAVVVGVAAVDAHQAAVERRGLVVTPRHDERLGV